jgi:predicted deacylase
MIRKDLHTRELASGAQLSIPVFHLPGSNKQAPSVYIQSTIHGSEVQGYLVALQLIEHFAKHTPKGDVTIVPLSNPYGLNFKLGEYTFGRFDPVTGDNWNRNYIDFSSLVKDFLEEHRGKEFNELIPLFRQAIKEQLEQKLYNHTSYHKKLALQLQSLALSADIVLDLHCDTISVPHLYSTSYALDSAHNLNIPFIIEIPDSFAGALDEATFCPWVTLTEQYNTINSSQLRPPVEAFTIELGNQEHINTEAAHNQTAGILNYLSIKGAIESINLKLQSQLIHSCKLKDFITIHAPRGGLVIKNATLGQTYQAGEPLVSLSNPALWNKLDAVETLISQSAQKLHSDRDSIPITKSASPIAHEGMALMKIMTHYTTV